MDKYIATILLSFIIGGLIYIYLSIYFNRIAYTKKVKKYKQIQLLKFRIRNRKKRRGS